MPYFERLNRINLELKESVDAMSLESVLQSALGNNCEEELDIFLREKIDLEAFWLLDKETLVELGLRIGPRMKLVSYLNKAREMAVSKDICQEVECSKAAGSQSPGSNETTPMANSSTIVEYEAESSVHFQIEKDCKDPASASNEQSKEGDLRTHIRNYLQKIQVQEGSYNYEITEQGTCIAVRCQTCNVVINVESKGVKPIEKLKRHFGTSRHKLNLALLGDDLSIDTKIEKLLNKYPETFILPTSQGKRIIRCKICSSKGSGCDFKTDSKLVFSNILQHVKSKKHLEASKKPKTATVTAYFQKKVISHNPIDL